MPKTVLILGGRGRFGRNATEAFKAHGWEVRQFDRRTGNLWDAAWGAKVIVNAWNPPYADWAALVPGLTRRVIEVAKSTGATVIIPGNVYNYGDRAPSVYAADTPHAATNPLGRVRIEMEAAYRASGVRTIVLRAGDFIDTRPSGNWFDMMMIPRIGKGKFTYPGNPDIEHAWAWLPDLARAAAELAKIRDELPAFADVPYAGYTLTGRQLCAAVGKACGRPLRLKKMNWLPIRVARPFAQMPGHLLEMRYLWNKPHRIDGATFDSLVPDLEGTPLTDAMPLAINHHIAPNQPVVACA